MALDSISGCGGRAGLLVLRKQFCCGYKGVKQGCHFPNNMKFPDFFGSDFSRPRLSSTVIPRPSPENFKIRIFNLAENEFQKTKFPDFSLTFGIQLQIP